MRKTLLFASSVLLLAACTQTPVIPDDTMGQVSSASVSTVEYASYQGTLETAGPSIYMEGTHRLTLADGRFLLLTSENVNLDSYLDSEVEVYGAVSDTVESGGKIMQVVTITPLSDMSSSASSDAMSAPMSSAASTEEMSSAMTSAAASTAMSAMPASKSAAASAKPASSATAMTPPPGEPDDAFTARVRAMAKENYAASNWTREYCTQHHGYCLPIHKNFYFKSFGSTTSALWHVEMSNAEIDLLGDGPISVNLVAGAVSAANATDGEVKTQGATVIGYRAWKDGQHIEVAAPVELKAAVEVLTAGIKAAPAQP
jgi:hypothetical protein